MLKRQCVAFRNIASIAYFAFFIGNIDDISYIFNALLVAQYI